MILPHMAPMKHSIEGHDTRVHMYRQELKVKEMILRVTIAHLCCRAFRRMLARVTGCTQAKEEGVDTSLQRGAILWLRQLQAGDADACPAVNHQHQVHV